MERIYMEITVNGTTAQLRSAPHTSLLTVLREDLGITSPKPGCEQGGCGACTVLLDGYPVRSCLVPVAAVESRPVTTVEGLSNDKDLTPVQNAFFAHYGAQCGYCTSGMIVAATHLIEERGTEISKDTIVESMGGHLCRCTGYVKIIEAVEAAARGDLAEPDGPIRLRNQEQHSEPVAASSFEERP